MTLLRPGAAASTARAALTVLLAAAASPSFSGAQPATPTRPHHPDVPYQSPTSLGAASYAKIVCSAVFVSGRDVEEARKNSAFFLMAAQDRTEPLTVDLDRDAKRVRATLKGVTRTAVFYGDQGCVIHPEGSDRVHFTQTPVRTALPDAASQPWPMGDAPPSSPWPARLDKARMQAAVDLAFSDPEGLTAAVVVVHKGQIVGERYMPGITKDTQLESWSMGKSLTATLVGLEVQRGSFRLDDPAPVPAWRRPGDPRGAIRVRDVMQMSSGLSFTGQDDRHLDPKTQYPDHFFIYAGAVNAFAYSTSSPIEFAPGVVGRYRNSDPMTLGFLVRQAVEARGEDYLTHPQRTLFDKIGIRRQVLEVDPWGNFLLSGYDYGTARNWARLGMLYLQDGVWNGQRLLPEGWARFISTPAPSWKRKEYGGQFWVNGEGQWDLPRDAYFMSGAGGQHTFIVPSHDLVVVRMGHQRGAPAGTKTLNQALAAIVATIDLSRAGASGAAGERRADTLRPGKGDRRFAGNWRLVSFVNFDEKGGRTESPFTGGRIMYDGAGQMAAQLTYADRPAMPTPSTEPQRAAAYQSFLSYYGGYVVDDAGKNVTHLVEASTNPNWPGTDLVRYFEFADNGNTLKLSVRNDAGRTTGTLTWARIK
jgi:CubicO group peptidase (beta-lactamase class C family)